MSRKHQVLRNAAVSAAQGLATGGVWIILYPFLIRSLGTDQFGIWALVVSWTSATSLANLGLSGGAVKYTSQYLARGDAGRVISVVQTAVLSIAAVFTVVLLCAYPVLSALVHALLHTPDVAQLAQAILPGALLSFLLYSVAGALIGCIDGCHRMDLRSLLMLGTSLLYFLACLILVPTYGLHGLVTAQILQNGCLAAGAWILLRRILPDLPILPRRWSKDTLREMMGYSLNMQATSLLMLFADPVAKTLIAHFSGVSVVAPFEVAHRMVMQLRSMIVAAYSAVVPALAELQETGPDRIQHVYRRSFRLLLFIILPSIPVAIGLLPLVSRLWFGYHDELFVLYGRLIFAAWFVNILAAPAYFSRMGTGELTWNVRGHAITAVLTPGLGTLLGLLLGGTGVVIGYACAIVAGSALMIISYQYRHGIRAVELIQVETLVLSAAAVAGTSVAIFFESRFGDQLGPIVLLGGIIVVVLAAVAVPLWLHPVRTEIQEWATRSISGRFSYARSDSGHDV